MLVAVARTARMKHMNNTIYFIQHAHVQAREHHLCISVGGYFLPNS